MNKLLNIIRLIKNIYSTSVRLTKLRLESTITVLAINPFTVMMENVPLGPEEIKNAASTIKYIALALVQGETEREIIIYLASIGYEITHEAFIYGVQCALALGQILDSQIPLSIYEQLAMESLEIAKETGNKILQEIVYQQIEESIGLVKTVVDEIKDFIRSFVKEHPVITAVVVLHLSV